MNIDSLPIRDFQFFNIVLDIIIKADVAGANEL